MSVIIEYHGKRFEWCRSTVDSFVNDWAARFWAIGNGWSVV